MNHDDVQAMTPVNASERSNTERVLLADISPPVQSEIVRTNEDVFIVSAPDEREELLESIDQEGVKLPVAVDVPPFEQYYEDQTRTDPKMKIALILFYCMTGLVEGLSLSSLHETPFKEQNIHHIKPRKTFIKEELKRRDPSASKSSACNLGELLELLARTHDKMLTDGCRIFIIKKYDEIHKLFAKSIKDR